MEIEAKFLARREAVLDEIAAQRRLGPYELEPIATKLLETIYVDTARRDLSRAGLALRIRRAGSRLEATIKGRGHVSNEVHRRPELTVKLSKAPRFPIHSLPDALRDHVLPASHGRPLVPLLLTRISRRALLVRRRGAFHPLAEIDLDRVDLDLPPNRTRKVKSSGRRFFEVEVELKEGEEHDLARIVAELRARHELRPSRFSKLERGLRWAKISGSLRRTGASRRKG